MTDLKLYTLVITDAGQAALGNQHRQQLATAGLLGEDVGAVEQIASAPGEQTITGHYRGQYAAKMAAELEELASASGFESVPLVGMDTATNLDGYYAIKNADIEPPRAATDHVQQFRLTLSKTGRRGSHFRGVATNPRQVDHTTAWGNDTTAEIGVPASAAKVRWFDPDSKDLASATTVTTRSGELGDVDVYDAYSTPLSTDTPVLVYEIDYDDEERLDCRVWDTRETASKTDVDDVLQWQKVFATDHDMASDAELILDNGLLRLRLDEAGGTIAAESWDETNTTWSSVALGDPSGWALFDVDILAVSMVSDSVQLLFEHDTEGLFALDATLIKGQDVVLFSIPENETGPIPAGLEDWFGPIASSSVLDPTAGKDAIARAEVRR